MAFDEADGQAQFALELVEVAVEQADFAFVERGRAQFGGGGQEQLGGVDDFAVGMLHGFHHIAADGTVTNLTTPPSDVLKYTLADGSWIAVRPSGTEPKIKFYIAVVGESNEDSQAKIANIEAEINAFVK